MEAHRTITTRTPWPGLRFSIRRLLLAVAAGAIAFGGLSRLGPTFSVPFGLLASLGVLHPRLLRAIPFVLLFCMGATFYSISESYCFFYPTIDTCYAPGYSEAGFDGIVAGMPADSVRRILGDPLYVTAEPGRPGCEVWQYTGDGECSWGDWAWFSRSVVVEGGRVTSKKAVIMYD